MEWSLGRTESQDTSTMPWPDLASLPDLAKAAP